MPSTVASLAHGATEVLFVRARKKSTVIPGAAFIFSWLAGTPAKGCGAGIPCHSRESCSRKVSGYACPAVFERGTLTPRTKTAARSMPSATAKGRGVYSAWDSSRR